MYLQKEHMTCLSLCTLGFRKIFYLQLFLGIFLFGFCFVVGLITPNTFQAKHFPFTFSNFSLTGLGFVAVTASAIS